MNAGPEAKRLRHRVDEQCFCKTGNTNKQTMPAAEDADENILHHLILPHNDFGDF